MRDSKFLGITFVMATLALSFTAMSALGLLPDMNVLERPLRTRVLVLEDASGRSRGFLTTRPNDAPMLSLLDSSGTVRLELSLTPTERPGLSLISPDGTSRLTVSLRSPGGQPELTLYSEEGRRAWRVRLNEAGVPEGIGNEPVPPG